MNARVGIAVVALGLMGVTVGCKRESGGATTQGSPSPGTAASGAADVKLPTSTTRATYREEALVVTIGTTGIRIGETRAAIIPLPPAGEAALGVTGEYKGGTRASFYLTALGDAVRSHWGDASPEAPRATLVVDETVPFRVLVEVLFTLGRLRVSDVCLAVHKDARRACIEYKMPGAGPTTAALSNQADEMQLAMLGALGSSSATSNVLKAPDASAPPARASASAAAAPSPAPAQRPQLGPLTGTTVTLIVAKDGYFLKSSGGSIAPGCDKVGPGLTVPKIEGRFDTTGLRACLQKVRAAFDAGAVSFVLTASGDTTFQAIVDALDAARETDTGAPLMPAVMFAIPT